MAAIKLSQVAASAWSTVILCPNACLHGTYQHLPAPASTLHAPSWVCLSRAMRCRYHTTTAGQRIFWQVVRPKDLAKIANVIIFHHGFSDHSGWLCLNKQLTFAKLTGSATFAFDM